MVNPEQIGCYNCYSTGLHFTQNIIPIFFLATGKMETVAENYGYSIEAESLASTDLDATYVDIIDGTVAGVACKGDKIFAVQYEPNTTSGPEGRKNLYEEFIALMKEGK